MTNPPKNSDMVDMARRGKLRGFIPKSWATGMPELSGV
jgi:hypothetical protein